MHFCQKLETDIVFVKKHNISNTRSHIYKGNKKKRTIRGQTAADKGNLNYFRIKLPWENFLNQSVA